MSSEFRADIARFCQIARCFRQNAQQPFLRHAEGDLLRQNTDFESTSKDGGRATCKRQGGILKRRDEIQGRVESLEPLVEMIGKTARGKTCEAIQGIISEGEEIIEEFKGFPALDAGLISAAQAIVPCEIARFGTPMAWANQLDLTGAVPLLQATLDDEKATDKK